MNRPPPGTMVYWRWKRDDGKPAIWLFGYCTYVSGPDLIRMGAWNGDVHHGYIVSINDIEWRPYSREYA